LKAVGPGQRFETELPAQSLIQRQLPGALPQLGLVQHLMLPGSAGQAPLMVVPPADEQLDEVMQTPVRDVVVSELVSSPQGAFCSPIWGSRMAVGE